MGYFSYRFFCINTVVVYGYTSSFQKVDDEEYGGVWELVKEGFMTSFAGFLVCDLRQCISFFFSWPFSFWKYSTMPAYCSFLPPPWIQILFLESHEKKASFCLSLHWSMLFC